MLNLKSFLSKESKGTQDSWYFAALEECADGHWDWNASKNEVYISRKLRDLIGYSEEETKHNNLGWWLEKIHPDDQAEIKRKFEELSSSKIEFTYFDDFRFLCKNGDYIWLENQAKILRDDHDNLIRVTGMAINNTPQKYIHNQLIEIYEKPVNIRALIQEVHGLLLPVALQKRLKFDTLLSHPVPENVKTDPVRLRQILLNLTTNALKFTNNGHVQINVSTAPLSDTRQELIFEIIDSGVGISKEDQVKIFDDSFSENNLLLTRADGSGLGLNFVKSLVHLMRGKLGVKSEVGLGSTFWFSVPVDII